MRGLDRLLASETNISDLLAYFSERDPAGWGELVDRSVASVARESTARTKNRADLVLSGVADEVIGAVEVKLGHHLSPEQAKWYQETFDDDVSLILTSLDREGPSGEVDGDRWVHVPLVDLVSRWATSGDREVATIASAAHRVLAEWSSLINAVAVGEGGGAAKPVAAIVDPFLGRVLTRTLEHALAEHGVVDSWAGVTTGGGNAILQGWKPVPDEPEYRYFIAEVRWAPAHQQIDLRFGVDVHEDGRGGRAAAWRLAQLLDDAIRVDAFASYLRAVDPKRAELLVSTRGSGRPSAKGTWETIVERGFRKGDASSFNPGFRRDGDTRFEASTRVDTLRATGPDVVALLGHALRHLEMSAQSATSTSDNSGIAAG